MDTAMRDLERIRERSPGEGSSRVGVFVLAAMLTAGVIYGIGGMMTLEDTDSPNDDPLAALSQAAALATEAEKAEAEAEPPIEVDREALTFPSTLLQDERPEVEATLAAAAAEHAVLSGDEAPRRRTPAPVPMPVATAPTSLPAASVATSEAQTLEQTARHDPLVAAALPAEAEPRGTVGMEGPYTLQVISYRTREEADVFAEALRTRGHDAYVLNAEVEGRGTFYRVRIGPFETARAAESHRRTFEREEQMNTFVVRRRET